MTQTDTTVDAARARDRTAFADLIRRYQDMAFGYALSILGDYHTAEDATQEAFVSAYFSLPTLRDPAAFPGWLRGIVRHHCFRLIRGRRATLVPLDQALDLPGPGAGPEEHAERSEVRDQVLDAVMALPDGQREIVALYYIGDHSQREIAGFLGLPVTTVNNRLHAARQRLKGGLITMVKDDLQKHALPENFAEKIGKIIEVRGPVVEAQFAPESTPELLDTVMLEEKLALAVMQQLADGRVRCIALNELPDLEPGMDVTNTGVIVQRPVSAAVLREAVAILVRPAGQTEAMVETGIKALDLLCPLPAGGTFGLYGPHGAGKLVVLAEMLHRLTDGQEITVLNFVQTGAPELMRPPGDEALPNAAGPIETFYLPVDDAAEASSRAVQTVHEALQGTVYISRAMALAGLYPCIDPLVSWSRLLSEDVVGKEHVEVAEQVRDMLRRFHVLQEQPGEARSVENQTVLATAERLRAYLTQPFFTAEPYTKKPGEYVPAPQTVRDCREILSGRHHDLPVEAFRFAGTLEQILARRG